MVDLNTRKLRFKGFLFSLDAIFALIVASAAVSLLLYVHYAQPVSFQLQPSKSTSLLNELSNLNGADMATAYPLYAQLQGQSLQATWPQYGGNQGLNSSTSYGPMAPETLFTFISNGIDTSPVAYGGLVAFGSGSRLYALNATTGAVVINVSTGSSLAYAPLMYGSSIIYANSSGYVDEISTNASALSAGKTWTWSAGVGNRVNSQLSLADGYIGFGAADGAANRLYIIDPQTGALVTYQSLPNQAINASAPLYIGGELITTTPAPSGMNNVTAFRLSGSSLVTLWTRTIGSKATSYPASFWRYIAFANGTSFTILHPNGSTLYPVNVLGGAEEGGIGVLGGSNPYAYAHTSNALYILKATPSNGISYVAVANTLDGSYNGTPSISQYSRVVYLPDGPYIQAYSSSDGAMKWSISLIPAKSYAVSSEAALAYGNLYVTSGHTLYALGEPKVQSGQSALDAIANMYLNGYGGPADVIMHSAASSYNDGMLIDGRYAPSLDMANFDSQNSMVYVPNSTDISVKGANITMAGWFYANTFKPVSGTSGFIAGKYGEYALGINASSSSSAKPWISLNISGTQKNYTPNYAISSGAWHFEAAVFNGSSISVFIDGNLVGNTPVSGTLSSTSMPMLIGCMNVKGSCSGASSDFNGSISGVQIYSGALNETEIQQLYQEGAAGAPMPGRSISGWWPLDGDANDYSGNAADGFAFNTTFDGTSYTPSSLSNAFQVSKASIPLYISTNGVFSKYNVSIAVWR